MASPHKWCSRCRWKITEHNTDFHTSFGCLQICTDMPLSSYFGIWGSWSTSLATAIPHVPIRWSLQDCQPSNCGSWTWLKAELQCRVWSELIAFEIEHWHGKQSFAWETFIAAILEAWPILPSLEYQQSDSLTWVTHILCDSKILDAPNTWPNEIVSTSSATFGHSLHFR